VWATKITGSIKSKKDEKLSFAAVNIKDKNKGTIANEDGQYVLDLPAGTYTLEFRLIGYKTKVATISVANEAIKLDVELEEVGGLSTKEVAITAIDPAVRVMKKAIKKRVFYQEQIAGFQARVYMKGINRFFKMPKKVLGKELELEKNDTINKGVFYLSESTSDYYYNRKQGNKEVMIASKVSGEPKGISFNNYTTFRIPIYYSKYPLPSAKRPVISPLADNALFYYRFRLEDEYMDNGLKIYKIKLEPRRRSDPAFQGFIYIQDSTWRVHAVDFLAVSSTGLEIIDSLKLRQTMYPVNDSIWMPASEQFTFHAAILGIELGGTYSAAISNYKINPVFPDELFEDKVLLRIDTGLNKFPDSYWDSIRTVPLTTLEKDDYRIKDSLFQITQTPAYRDSLERERKKRNKFFYQVKPPYFGLYKKVVFTADSGRVSYGWQNGFALADFSAVKSFSLHSPMFVESKKYYLKLTPEYAFVPKLFFMDGLFTIKMKPRAQSITFSGGNVAAQFNDAQPINLNDNMNMSLFAKRNLIQQYLKAYGRIDYFQKVNRNFSFVASAEFANRGRLYVNSQYSFYNKSAEFAPNDPLIGNAAYSQTQFLPHNALTVSASFTWQPKSYGMIIGGEEINVGSKWPTFKGGYRKGISGIGNSQVNYDFVHASVHKKLSFDLFGVSQVSLGGGTFLNAAQVQFPDAAHFLGNRGNAFYAVREQQFITLPYYKYSTNGSFGQFHLSHNFAGFFFNKVPLLRKLKFNEIVGVSALLTSSSKPYYEYRVGVGNILKVLGIYYGSSFAQDGANYRQLNIGVFFFL